MKIVRQYVEVVTNELDHPLYSTFHGYCFIIALFTSSQRSSIYFHGFPVEKFVKTGMPQTMERNADPWGHNGPH